MDMVNGQYLLSFAIIAFSLLLVSNVFADVGSKPTAEMEIRYNGMPVGDQVFYAKMLECSKKPDALAEYNDFSGFPNALNVTIYDSNKDCYWHPAQLEWDR